MKTTALRNAEKSSFIDFRKSMPEKVFKIYL